MTLKRVIPFGIHSLSIVLLLLLLSYFRFNAGIVLYRMMFGPLTVFRSLGVSRDTRNSSLTRRVVTDLAAPGLGKAATKSDTEQPCRVSKLPANFLGSALAKNEAIGKMYRPIVSLAGREGNT
jgi:hypothetical protein